MRLRTTFLYAQPILDNSSDPMMFINSIIQPFTSTPSCMFKQLLRAQRFQEEWESFGNIRINSEVPKFPKKWKDQCLIAGVLLWLWMIRGWHRRSMWLTHSIELMFRATCFRDGTGVVRSTPQWIHSNQLSKYVPSKFYGSPCIAQIYTPAVASATV